MSTQDRLPQLLHLVSHDLRTPLNAMVGWTHILQSSQSTPALREQALAGLTRAIQQQLYLIESLTSTARLLTAAHTDAGANCAVEKVMSDAIAVHRSSASRKDVALEIGANAATLTVAGEGACVTHALALLLELAIKVTPAHAAIALTALAGEQFVEIELRTTGGTVAMMPRPVIPTHADHDNEAVQHGSFGLALTIARELIASHAGVVAAERSNDGDAVHFVMRLQRVDPLDVADRASSAG